MIVKNNPNIEFAILQLLAWHPNEQVNVERSLPNPRQAKEIDNKSKELRSEKRSFDP
jgi:hypothetical protein